MDFTLKNINWVTVRKLMCFQAPAMVLITGLRMDDALEVCKQPEIKLYPHRKSDTWWYPGGNTNLAMEDPANLIYFDGNSPG